MPNSTVIFCMATQIDESRLRKKTLLNLICCTLNLRKVYYTLNIQCSTHAQNCRSAAKYSSTIQCGVHSFAEWPGVAINQGEKVGPRKKDRSQFGKKISSYSHYPLISNIRPYPLDFPLISSRTISPSYYYQV